MKQGYYRIKTSVSTTPKSFNMAIDGQVVGTKTAQPIDFCEGDRILKFLDNNGQYRFVSFGERYETKTTAKQIGTTNNLITNILNSGGVGRVVGYNSNNFISASIFVTDSILPKITDMYASPRIFLYVGNGNDTANDWIAVECSFSNPIVKIRKGIAVTLSVTIKLPDNYSVKMM